MNQPSSPKNQSMNDGMREALNKSVNSDALKKVANMMMKTAKMLSMGHLDPTYMMETMDAMLQIMPEETEQEAQAMPPEMGPGMGQASGAMQPGY